MQTILLNKKCLVINIFIVLSVVVFWFSIHYVPIYKLFLFVFYLANIIPHLKMHLKRKLKLTQPFNTPISITLTFPLIPQTERPVRAVSARHASYQGLAQTRPLGTVCPKHT